MPQAYVCPDCGTRYSRKPQAERGERCPVCNRQRKQPLVYWRVIGVALGTTTLLLITLIFGLERYEAVMDAFLSGMEQAKANGHELSRMASVASFFVSRVDTEVDKRLDKIGSPEAQALHGKAAIANARLAYERYEKVFTTDRWKALADAGGRPHCGRPPRRRTRPTATSCTSRS